MVFPRFLEWWKRSLLAEKCEMAESLSGNTASEICSRWNCGIMLGKMNYQPPAGCNNFRVSFPVLDD